MVKFKSLIVSDRAYHVNAGKVERPAAKAAPKNKAAAPAKKAASTVKKPTAKLAPKAAPQQSREGQRRDSANHQNTGGGGIRIPTPTPRPANVAKSLSDNEAARRQAASRSKPKAIASSGTESADRQRKAQAKNPPGTFKKMLSGMTIKR